MQVQFSMRPLEEVAPWGEDEPELHWYGLTDGYYWIELDGVELFRHSPEHLDASDPPVAATDLPYLDYYVVQLWDDLFDLLPRAMTPLPDALTQRIEAPGRWRQWRRQVSYWKEQCADDDGETVDQATRWWDNRRLDVSYLRTGPQVWIWRHGGDVQIRWDASEPDDDGTSIWTAGSGEASIPAAKFLGEMRSFHERLMGQMAERVQQARRSWPHPDVAIDLDALDEEQAARSAQGEAALTAAQHALERDFDPILQAIAELEERYPLPTTRPN
ncbi:MAG: DUF5984 family protein [Chloroflexi bacterium]|nr:DUF5984 family protein [Chloroflexota bacterium]